jgi:hypothetical protein
MVGSRDAAGRTVRLNGREGSACPPPFGSTAGPTCLPPPQTNTQPREIAAANAVGQAVLAGLCLWKGYE